MYEKMISHRGRIVFHVGDLVCYSDSTNETLGIITRINGKKWFKVRWHDGVILDEHKNDIRLAKKKAG